jgi:hypothetical protein
LLQSFDDLLKRIHIAPNRFRRHAKGAYNPNSQERGHTAGIPVIEKIKQGVRRSFLHLKA